MHGFIFSTSYSLLSGLNQVEIYTFQHHAKSFILFLFHTFTTKEDEHAN